MSRVEIIVHMTEEEQQTIEKCIDELQERVKYDELLLWRLRWMINELRRISGKEPIYDTPEAVPATWLDSPHERVPLPAPDSAAIDTADISQGRPEQGSPTHLGADTGSR